ncbi:MAG: hypothetical protein R6U65_11615 [Perlabentimonas sp.]
MKKTRVKLEIPQESSHYYAISCNEPMHKLAWMINTELNTNFKEGEPVRVNEIDYPIQVDGSIFLIKNRHSNGKVLVQKLNNVDYVLKETGGMTDDARRNLVSELKKIDSINAVINLDVKAVKGLVVLNNLY